MVENANVSCVNYALILTTCVAEYSVEVELVTRENALVTVFLC